MSSQDNEGEITHKRQLKQETMKFKSTHALCEDLKMILDMPEMCDVTFVVGPQQVPVYGVRAIMATRSR